jgi:hypothetical protein
MSVRIIGELLFAKDSEGKLKSRIGTLFPRARTLVTLPGIHATQRMAYIATINAERKTSDLPPLSDEEEMVEWQQSVDLIMDENTVLIRPDPENMPLAFEADELLQELVSKRQIKFLNAMNDRVRQAIKERGENWRIAPWPRSPDEMKRMILSSFTPIGGRSIYYYSHLCGTRYLTYQQFAELGNLPDSELIAHLLEIRNFSGRYNRMGRPEISFFATHGKFSHDDFPQCDSSRMTATNVRHCFETMKLHFSQAVRPELIEDNPEHTEWRNLMFSALIGQDEQTVPEEIIMGMGSEFFMQIEWLPGGRIEEGELLFDSVFEEHDRTLCDEKARGFIFNFVREFGDIEYVNVGRIIGSLSHRPTSSGRRDVYVAEIKQRRADRPLIRVLRMQKWGIQEHLEEQKDLLTAIMQAEEYTDYILDRRLGCRQLGMNLPHRNTTRKISERYHGTRHEYEGQTIWSTYFEREYIPGMATDKIPRSRFLDPKYSLKFADVLGRAAAPNIIVGRMNLSDQVLFDDGDEVLLEDEAGIPKDILVSDHTGTFTEYMNPLEQQAAGYAAPINRRLAFIACPKEVTSTYVESFMERFIYIQQEYRKRKRAFDTLFKHRLRDEQGSFAYRWERVLDRLNRTDPTTLADRIRRNIHLP